ncbi:hypothetical protein [Enterobacter sp. RHBSTW-00175]|uniref:hypothetical protein n=1 Tax=Enterobacter sp. RHBSTW-00175 TaxID=2742639 RepID=UPI0015EAEA78|nr:hypothetical protein [Enterobacter sp. RHBSTW-00175]HDR2786507.1 hypothetical protein [Enterobacter asburiae]QMR74312.1 hypothetical protein HV107_01155 [Enterobacter sp. RHBSTW-00175]HDR2802747.1 hypothetical protein [Enterobacter asburiae]HDR2808176.1 hypothetical protein [Enterobacter asburiae]HDR2813613.1 hypothetical protein [Enterobacter asburiae]
MSLPVSIDLTGIKRGFQCTLVAQSAGIYTKSEGHHACLMALPTLLMLFTFSPGAQKRSVKNLTFQGRREGKKAGFGDFCSEE